MRVSLAKTGNAKLRARVTHVRRPRQATSATRMGSASGSATHPRRILTSAPRAMALLIARRGTPAERKAPTSAAPPSAAMTNSSRMGTSVEGSGTHDGSPGARLWMVRVPKCRGTTKAMRVVRTTRAIRRTTPGTLAYALRRGPPHAET